MKKNQPKVLCKIPDSGGADNDSGDFPTVPIGGLNLTEKSFDDLTVGFMTELTW